MKVFPRTLLLPWFFLSFYLELEVETDFNIFFNHGIPCFNSTFNKIINSLLSVRAKDEISNSLSILYFILVANLLLRRISNLPLVWNSFNRICSWISKGSSQWQSCEFHHTTRLTTSIVEMVLNLHKFLSNSKATKNATVLNDL